ncbi:MAG: hypothetical protein KDN05_24670, partial [Verrucomicrobiae bacterium]|nr:hypothetical protein [Verrucomicrobiae bacterium]
MFHGAENVTLPNWRVNVPEFRRLWEGLSAEREQIEKETGLALTWNNPREGKYDVSTVRIYDDPRNPKNREEIKAFMRDALNRY